ncbi:hypothetical protein ACP70R_000886 [Stipagrostis hirtigluma subsp. patula]
MDTIWDVVARAIEESRIRAEVKLQRKAAMAEDREEGRVCWHCGNGKPGTLPGAARLDHGGMVMGSVVSALILDVQRRVLLSFLAS